MKAFQLSMIATTFLAWQNLAAQSPSPLPSPYPSEFKSLALNSYSFGHSCAVLQSGAVKCWGDNTVGQLGTGLPISFRDIASARHVKAMQAVSMPSSLKAIQVSVGFQHSCALLSDASVVCWGANDDSSYNPGAGILGRSTQGQYSIGRNPSDILVRVNLGTNAKAKSIVSGTFHNCALLTDGRVKCWGIGGAALGLEDSGSRGEFDFQMGDALPAVNLGTGRKATALFSNSLAQATCAILDNGSVKCWGSSAGSFFQLAGAASPGADLGTMGDNLAPLDIGVGRKALFVYLSSLNADTSACVALDNGTVKCWELNKLVRYVNGNYTYDYTYSNYTLNFGANRVLKMTSSAPAWICGLLTNGQVKCWNPKYAETWPMFAVSPLFSEDVALEKLNPSYQLSNQRKIYHVNLSQPVADLNTGVAQLGALQHDCYTYYNGRTDCADEGGKLIYTSLVPDNKSAPLQAHLIFLSSRILGADMKDSFGFTGLAGADRNCQDLGSKMIPGLNWKAILSTRSERANYRITIRGAVMNLAFQLVAEDAANFWSGDLLNPVIFDEAGNFVSAAEFYPVRVFTSTDEKGFFSSPNNQTGCNGFTDLKGSTVIQGMADSTSQSWMKAIDSSCSETGRIYCISQ
jgi:hypothetical protein